MANLTIIIPDAKVARVAAAFKGTHPIPTNEDGSPAFTDNQWPREYLRRLIVRTVLAYERQAATANVVADPDVAA